jgi:hypothetical protein
MASRGERYVAPPTLAPVIAYRNAIFSPPEHINNKREVGIFRPETETWSGCKSVGVQTMTLIQALGFFLLAFAEFFEDWKMKDILNPSSYLLVAYF